MARIVALTIRCKFLLSRAGSLKSPISACGTSDHILYISDTIARPAPAVVIALIRSGALPNMSCICLRPSSLFSRPPLHGTREGTSSIASAPCLLIFAHVFAILYIISCMILLATCDTIAMLIPNVSCNSAEVFATLLVHLIKLGTTPGVMLRGSWILCAFAYARAIGIMALMNSSSFALSSVSMFFIVNLSSGVTIHVL